MLLRYVIILTCGVLVDLSLMTPLSAQGAKGPEVVLGLQSEEKIVETWSALLREAAEADAFSGAVLLAKDGEPIYQEAFGFADRDLGVENAVDTRFNIGSEGKMFTAVAIAQLVERGLIEFHDPIIKHIPDYPSPKAAEQITIHHLLTHTSGLGFYPFRNGGSSIEEIMRLFANDGLAFVPGSEFQYSNAGYVVLGVVIERVTGVPYWSFVSESVFEPAGMLSTGPFPLDIPLENRAIPYVLDDQTGARVSAVPLLEPVGSPAGGSYSTVGDMLRFASALGKHVLLGPELTETLFQGKIEMGPPGLKYAYGFGEHVVNGHRSIGHNGGAPGVAADFRMYLDDGFVTVLFSNFGGRAAMELARSVEAMINEW